MATRRDVPVYEKFGIATPIEDARLRLHAFRAGDRLSVLAADYFGDWTLWRIIADRNEITDPRKIPVGTILIIPDIPLEEGDFISR